MSRASDTPGAEGTASCRGIGGASTASMGLMAADSRIALRLPDSEFLSRASLTQSRTSLKEKEVGMKHGVLTQIMAFLYSIAHYLGTWIVVLIQKILPMAKELSTLADPIGYLAILTIFVIVAATAKRVAFVIVLVGWVLIIIRIVLMTLGI